MRINRPELPALEAQSHTLKVQERLLTAGLMPRIGLFIQGGYGRPGLNMLENSFEPFYVAGVRFSWNVGTFYTLRNDRRKIETNRQMLDVQRDIFLYNTSLRLIRQNAEIEKMQQLVASSHEIVALRTSIRQAAEAKLSNGVISVADLIREIQAEALAHQALATQRILQLAAIYDFLYTTN
jgi:outer membrane protein TolC